MFGGLSWKNLLKGITFGLAESFFKLIESFTLLDEGGLFDEDC